MKGLPLAANLTAAGQSAAKTRSLMTRIMRTVVEASASRSATLISFFRAAASRCTCSRIRSCASALTTALSQALPSLILTLLWMASDSCMPREALALLQTVVTQAMTVLGQPAEAVVLHAA